MILLSSSLNLRPLFCAIGRWTSVFRLELCKQDIESLNVVGQAEGICSCINSRSRPVSILAIYMVFTYSTMISFRLPSPQIIYLIVGLGARVDGKVVVSV